MKKFLIIISLIISCNIFCQKKDFNYKLNHLEVIVTKNYSYEKGYPERVIYFSNSSDSTYTLKLMISKNRKEAKLFDFKNKQAFLFEIDKIDFNEGDLDKLKNVKLVDYYFHNHEKIIDKKSVEKIEFGRDTIANKIIAHVTKYKNEKLTKIIHEDYLIFEKTFESRFKKHNEHVKSIIKKHQIKLLERESLKKLLCLKDGKINLEINYIENKDIDKNIKFSL